MTLAKNFCVAALLTLGCAATTMAADCAYPQKPTSPPNGAEAAKRGDDGLKEMVAAQRATKQFDADVKSYQECLNTETQTMIAALGDKVTAEEVENIKSKQDKKANDAYEDAAKVAEAFNVQLRAYKAK